VNSDRVLEILTSGHFSGAVDRHAALVRELGLPCWSPGIGYRQVVEGRTPPEAGTPNRPPRSLAELRGPRPEAGPLDQAEPLRWFHDTCESAFAFLEHEFQFQRVGHPVADCYPRMAHGVYLIGPGNLRLGYKNAYMLSYRSQHVIVVVEGLSFGRRTRMCLIDSRGRHLDFTRLVECREPEFLDLGRLAGDQREQIPLFAQALRKCGPDVLAGDLAAIPVYKHPAPGFSFNQFFSEADADYVLALHGPRAKRRTILAQLRRFVALRKVDLRIRRAKRGR
jgi:hypothetical protein